MEMTKEELIKRLIEMRKTRADETLDRVCESSTGCEDCPLYSTGRLCSHQVIDYLLDHIINNEEEYQETNLEHFWDKLHVHFDPHQVDGYLAFIDDSNMELKEWLLAPYKKPKHKYKLSQFEYDLLKGHLAVYGGGIRLNIMTLEAMQKLGYYNGIPSDMLIEDVIEDSEVIEE